MEPIASQPARRQPLLASVRHTIILVGIFVVIGAAGLIFQKHGAPGLPGQHPDVVPLYLSALAAEWALVYFVWRGLRGTGTRLRDLIGGRWNSASAAFTDIALGIAVSIAWIGAIQLWHSASGPSSAKSIAVLLPQTPAEIALWIVVSLSAGFCEEIVFRGYLQKQFAALTGSALLAVVLQAIVFGAGHAYQGVNAAVSTAVFGLLVGALALWRRNLWPSIVTHAWTDIFAGLLLRLVK